MLSLLSCAPLLLEASRASKPLFGTGHSKTRRVKARRDLLYTRGEAVLHAPHDQFPALLAVLRASVSSKTSVKTASWTIAGGKTVAGS